MYTSTASPSTCTSSFGPTMTGYSGVYSDPTTPTLTIMPFLFTTTTLLPAPPRSNEHAAPSPQVAVRHGHRNSEQRLYGGSLCRTLPRYVDVTYKYTYTYKYTRVHTRARDASRRWPTERPSPHCCDRHNTHVTVTAAFDYFNKRENFKSLSLRCVGVVLCCVVVCGVCLGGVGGRCEYAPPPTTTQLQELHLEFVPDSVLEFRGMAYASTLLPHPPHEHTNQPTHTQSRRPPQPSSPLAPHLPTPTTYSFDLCSVGRATKQDWCVFPLSLPKYSRMRAGEYTHEYRANTRTNTGRIHARIQANTRTNTGRIHARSGVLVLELCVPGGHMNEMCAYHDNEHALQCSTRFTRLKSADARV